MWEQIRDNKRKSVVLVLLMALLMMTLGFVIGLVVIPPGSVRTTSSGVNLFRYSGGFLGLTVAGVSARPWLRP